VESTSTKTNVVTLKIDGVEVKTTRGKRILEAALDNGIYIPNLCALRDIKLPTGACRLCQVKIEERRGFVTACSEPAADGMVIQSNTPEVNEQRRNVLHILLARHPHVCLTCHRRERCKPGDVCLRLPSVDEQHCILCPKNGRCELQKAVDFIGIGEMPYPYNHRGFPIERENPFVVRNNNLCILCGKCVRVDQEIIKVEAISFNRRGKDTFIGGAFGKTLTESGCTFCGCCVEVCPTGALMDVGDELVRWPDPRAAAIRCQYACPAGVDVPRFIRFIREHKYNEARAVIQEKVPLALICSHICSHPCEPACRRNDLDQGLAIRALERLAAERASVKWTTEGKASVLGRKVAIIGSGPAGLTAAYYLAKKGGHAVTIFEAESQAGGMLRTAIPEYDLPRKVLDDELEMLKRVGVEIKTQARVESVDRLFKDGFEAVFVAVGAHRIARLGIEGEDSPGVMDALSLLRQVNLGQKVNLGEKVAVIGSGYAAVQAARVALRLGAKSAVIICDSQKLAVPADEAADALAEGSEVETLLSPVKIVKIDSRLRLECAPAGRKRVKINGSGFTIEADNIIIAISATAALPDQFGLGLGDKQAIAVNPADLSTGRKGVFAGGDAVSGELSFIDAVAAGRKAAMSMDRFLGGSGDIDEVLTPVAEGVPRVGRIQNFAQRKRVSVPKVAAPERKQSFAKVELGYTDEQGAEEALRCMGCDLRFMVARMLSQTPKGANRAEGQKAI
jgi:NADPH-dependent glutamate synthase beta subunit-like oxidoreductase/NAD-dependent dihydropyrimidine dehydrogenase PreA subunit/ferredoxin